MGSLLVWTMTNNNLYSITYSRTHFNIDLASTWQLKIPPVTLTLHAMLPSCIASPCCQAVSPQTWQKHQSGIKRCVHLCIGKRKLWKQYGLCFNYVRYLNYTSNGFAVSYQGWSLCCVGETSNALSNASYRHRDSHRQSWINHDRQFVSLILYEVSL